MWNKHHKLNNKNEERKSIAVEHQTIKTNIVEECVVCVFCMCIV